MFSGGCLVLTVFTLPETYAPTILKRKAERKRKETGDNRWYAPIEAVKVPFGQRVSNILGKPFKLLFTEPMLLAMTIYMAFVYGCLVCTAHYHFASATLIALLCGMQYLLFEAYPIVFQEGHGFNAGIAGLMFLPLLVGAVLGCISVRFFPFPEAAPCHLTSSISHFRRSSTTIPSTTNYATNMPPNPCHQRPVSPCPSSAVDSSSSASSGSDGRVSRV
jgi:hypothetical protein